MSFCRWVAGDMRDAAASPDQPQHTKTVFLVLSLLLYLAPNAVAPRHQSDNRLNIEITILRIGLFGHSHAVVIEKNPSLDGLVIGIPVSGWRRRLIARPLFK